MLAEQHGLNVHPVWQHAVSFISGAAAGAAGTVASYPFDLLRTTLAAQGEPKVCRVPSLVCMLPPVQKMIAHVHDQPKSITMLCALWNHPHYACRCTTA